MKNTILKLLGIKIFSYFFLRRIKHLVINYIFDSENFNLENDYKIDNFNNLKVENNILLNTGFKFLGKGKLSIGEGTYLAPFVTVLTNTHDISNMNELVKDVEIGSYCWVGANVTILPGVKINDFSVVGAGSIVTKNTKPNSVSYGVPCKFLRVRNCKLPYRLPKGKIVHDFKK